MSFLDEHHPDGEQGQIRCKLVDEKDCQVCEAERSGRTVEEISALVVENEFSIKLCKFCLLEMKLNAALHGDGHHPDCDGNCGCDDD